MNGSDCLAIGRWAGHVRSLIMLILSAPNLTVGARVEGTFDIETGLGGGGADQLDGTANSLCFQAAPGDPATMLVCATLNHIR
jgi:hypothetical protein